MSFLVNEKLENIISKYSEIWDTFKELTGKNIVEVIHKNKYITTKIKSFENQTKPDFHRNELPTEQNLHLTYSLTDSVYKTDKSHYPQAFLEECKQIVKDKK